jgi:hypothetical protein
MGLIALPKPLQTMLVSPNLEKDVRNAETIMKVIV